MPWCNIVIVRLDLDLVPDSHWFLSKPISGSANETLSQILFPLLFRGLPRVRSLTRDKGKYIPGSTLSRVVAMERP